MRFEKVALSKAEGAILAHATPARPAHAAKKRRMIPKGTLLTAAHIADMAAEGVSAVQVAWIEPGDRGEDAAAAQLAEALIAGQSGLRAARAATGRVNLVAEGPGIISIDVDAINALNRVSPSITVATLREWRRVGTGGLVATIKIIPFAVPGADLEAACAAGQGAMGLKSCQFTTATLIETMVGSLVPSDKGRRAMEGRLAGFDMALTERVTVPHTQEAISAALKEAPGEVLLILTETATSDISDTAPGALRHAGGDVIHYGMPVDPGNLLFLGQFRGKPVIGLPGCARSPAMNGADWVLERVVCGGPIGAEEIMGMGVGGLLKEIPERGHPRR